MGSKVSKAKVSDTKPPTPIPVPPSTHTPAKAKTVVIPRIPQDVIDEILDHLAADSEFRALRACALVSRSWVQRCQRHIFHTVYFMPREMHKWMKRFPVPKEAPTHYVRDLHVWIGLDVETPERFFDHLPWFTNVDRMSLLGYGGSPLLRSFWRLPESVTSLTIDTGVVSLVQVQDIMVQLPNLDNLSVSGSPAPVDGRGLTGIGSSLRGRFGGRLVLADGYVDPDVTNMLLEIPSGLRFTEVQVYCTRERLLPAVRVVEACGKTLTKLSHMVNSRKSQSLLLVQLVLMHETSTLAPFSDIDCRKTFERSFNFEPSFNFSKIPNLQEVTFSLRVNRMGGDLPWIHTALSTLRPATSPCLPAICLDFGCLSRPALDLPVEVLMKNMGDDLRRTADEVARIERQSEGAVNFTVLRDPVFEVVLDTLNLLQQYKPCRASP